MSVALLPNLSVESDTLRQEARTVPLEILHRAAPCRNVPVTFTLGLTMDRCFLSSLVALICTAAPNVIRAEENRALLGCWRGESILQTQNDGVQTRSDLTRCSLRFTETEIVSRCTGAGANYIVYSYRLVRPGVYSARMTSHDSRPDLVGGEREYEYSVEGERLSIVTYPQSTMPSAPTRVIKVQSVSKRANCAPDA